MRAMSTYGDFDALFNAVVDQIEAGPFFLGSKFTTLDVLWGGALTWMTMFKLLPEHPIVAAYLGRLQPRPALARMRAKDQQLAATMSA